VPEIQLSENSAPDKVDLVLGGMRISYRSSKHWVALVLAAGFLIVLASLIFHLVVTPVKQSQASASCTCPKSGSFEEIKVIEARLMRQSQIQKVQQLFGPAIAMGSTYGGWLYYPNLVYRKAVVYSIGLGKDISWDLAMIRKHGVQIDAYDGTPVHLAWFSKQSPPDNFVHHAFIIGEIDGTVNMMLPVHHGTSYSQMNANASGFRKDSLVKVASKTLQTAVKESGHTHINVLKVDIEGAEFDLVSQLQQSTSVPICQLLIEFHMRLFPDGSRRQKRVLEQLWDMGFVPGATSFSTSSNPDGAVTFVNYDDCCRIQPAVCQNAQLLAW